MRFEPPTIKQRGQRAQAMAAVFARRPAHGEASGTLRCACGGRITFNIQSTGISRGHCTGPCGARWQQ